MSVLIKGMKMPKACLACPCFDEKDYVCKAIIKMLKKESIYHCRPEWCPLVAVPPHGRLIDADALPYLDIEWEDIVNAPTVIETEEGE